MILVVVLFSSLVTACTVDLVDVEPPVAPVPYEVTGRAPTGVGDFHVVLTCTNPGDVVVSGTCHYENVTPVEGTARSGADDEGWFCAGDAPELTPYGWVVITAACSVRR